MANFRDEWGLGIWLVVTAAACVACGGRSESEPDSSESTGSDAPNASDDDDETTTGENTGLDGDVPLGECVEGWPIYEGDCPWEGSDHLCYATKEDACACLCPQDRNSTCLSGLPGGPDSHTAVSCF